MLIEQDTRGILDYAFDKALDESALCSILLFVAKELQAALAAIDADRLIGVHRRSALGH